MLNSNKNRNAAVVVMMQRGVFYFIKNNCSKGPGLVAAAAGGNRRVELVCSGCHAVSEKGVWVINKPVEMCSADQAEDEEDRDESIRAKCSGSQRQPGRMRGGRRIQEGGELRTAA